MKARSSRIIINEIQRENPALKEFFGNFLFEFTRELLCDFLLCDRFHCFFLSIRFHVEKSIYIQEKLSKYRSDNSDKELVLLLYNDYFVSKPSKSDLDDIAFTSKAFDIVDSQGYENTEGSVFSKVLLDVNHLCHKLTVKLLLCKTPQDVHNFLWGISQFQNDKMTKREETLFNAIKQQSDIEHNNLVSLLICIDQVNKNDALRLSEYFGTLKAFGDYSNERHSFLLDNKLKNYFIGEVLDTEFSELN